jgi:protein SCO1/2
VPRLLVIAIVAAGIVAGAAVARNFWRAELAPPVLEHAVLFSESRDMPDFELVDQAGRPFTPERLRGRWTLLFFGFVNCPDVCPTTLATLAAARRSLEDLPAADRPAVTLVSVDPGRDTPEVLARYVGHFDPDFEGVTGRAESIAALTDGLGVAVIIGPPGPDGSYAVDHTAAIFLVGPDGRFAGLFGAPHDPGTIARDFRRIVAAR